MKKRFYIALGLFILQSATFLILGLILGPQTRASFLLAFFLSTFYLMIYFIGGVSKLFVYIIYGIGLFLFTYFFREYRFSFIIIGTFILLLNPLSYFENRLAVVLDAPEPIELQSLVTRSYAPYYDYRAKMKEYYHLPHTKRLYQSKKYYYLINLTTLFLAGLGIFLSLYELKTMSLELANLRLESILVFYIVVVIFVSALILYKKHFRSMMHFLTTSFTLPVALIVFMTNLSLAWKLSIASVAILATIIIVTWQIHSYYQRVVYHASKYIDSNNNHQVYANVLYEPYMFNDSYIIAGIYELNIDFDSFERNLERVLAYANFHLFFITSYVNTGAKIIVYTQFHKKHMHKAKKFEEFLNKVYKTNLTSIIKEDPTHEIYEKTFYQTHDYIAARAISFGKLMKQLEIQAPIIINMFFYFTDTNNLKDFVELYPVDILSLEENVITIKVEFEIVNVDYLIDFKIREVLLNSLINSGNYIRITASWRGEKL